MYNTPPAINSACVIRPNINIFYKSLILNREWDVVHAEQAVKFPVVKAMAAAARVVVTE
jgi:hypothetical protein